MTEVKTNPSKEIKELLVGLLRINKAVADIAEDGKLSFADFGTLMSLIKDHKVLSEAVKGLKDIDFSLLKDPEVEKEILNAVVDTVHEIINEYK